MDTIFIPQDRTAVRATTTTSLTGRQPKSNDPRLTDWTRRREKNSGFTLIEMILVMALLSAIFALASPSLSRFFKGRTILEEARRFLEVTRFAQAQAASLSVPLEVWHDPTERQYGISPLAGYQLDIKEALLLTYDETIHFNAIQNDARSVKGTVILFLPDGTLDEESLYAVSVQQDEDDAIYYIVQNEYGTGFELCDQEEYYNVQFRQSQLEKNFKK